MEMPQIKKSRLIVVTVHGKINTTVSLLKAA
jgi:hypothetical protein